MPRMGRGMMRVVLGVLVGFGALYCLLGFNHGGTSGAASTAADILLGFSIGVFFEMLNGAKLHGELLHQTLRLGNSTGTMIKYANALAAQAALAWKDLRLARRKLVLRGENTEWLEVRMFGLSAALRPFEGLDEEKTRNITIEGVDDVQKL